MRRLALKFSYDGAAFDGYARQPTGRTVEGEILRALGEIGAMADAASSRFGSASRTDKGVSAAGNVMAIDTEFDPAFIIPALNSRLAGIIFFGMAMVGDDFNARHARQRHYRYFLPSSEVPDKAGLTGALDLFEGEHDFVAFSKKDGEADTAITIDPITVEEEAGFLIVDIRASRFLWQMIRRMMGAAVSVSQGELSLVDVERSLSTGEYLPRLKPATPERLVLMDVAYDFEFELVGAPENVFENASVEASTRSMVMAQLARSLKTS